MKFNVEKVGQLLKSGSPAEDCSVLLNLRQMLQRQDCDFPGGE